MKHHDYLMYVNENKYIDSVHINLPVPINKYHGYAQHYSIDKGFYNAEIKSICFYEKIYHLVVSTSILDKIINKTHPIIDISLIKYKQLYNYCRLLQRKHQQVIDYYPEKIDIRTNKFVIIQDHKIKKRLLCKILRVSAIDNYQLFVKRLTQI